MCEYQVDQKVTVEMSDDIPLASFHDQGLLTRYDRILRGMNDKQSCPPTGLRYIPRNQETHANGAQKPGIHLKSVLKFREGHTYPLILCPSLR